MLGAIGFGYKSDEVSAIQMALTARGFNPGAVTGTYDAKTFAAVEAFQRKMGIGVDGLVGPNTIKALGLPPTAQSGTNTLFGARTASGAVVESEPVVGVPDPNSTMVKVVNFIKQPLFLAAVTGGIVIVALEPWKLLSKKSGAAVAGLLGLSGRSKRRARRPARRSRKARRCACRR